MDRTKKRVFDVEGAVESWYKLVQQQPLLPFVVPLLLFLWVVEKWLFSLSNWVLLACAVWATIQYSSHQQRNVVDDLNKKWKQMTLQNSPVTPLEHCEWLNKLLMEVWLSYINPKLSSQFASIVERRLKHRKSRLIERIELQEFFLGSRLPVFGLHGTRWATSGDQLLFMPILDGKAIAYSFVSTPEVRLGVAFGSGGSQSLPATELPGVSSWLVKLATETLNRRMVEPRRQCLSLPPEDLHKKAVGGILYVTVLSASRLSGHIQDAPIDAKDLQTFLEIELEELTRRTDVRAGSCPKWDSTFNLILHDNTGILKFHLYRRTPGSIKYDYLTSCEVKVRYVPDDSTIFWAIGKESSVIAAHADFCRKEVEMTVPFEGVNSGELTVRLVLKEWMFSDGSHSSTNFNASSHHSLSGSSNYFPRTGRKICITVVEGKDLLVKDKIGRSDPYVKLQFGK